VILVVESVLLPQLRSSPYVYLDHSAHRKPVVTISLRRELIIAEKRNTTDKGAVRRLGVFK